ncbi:hypothetical protein AMTR_s00056p00069820 [Amborella trichopoda]|uniref:Exostosin GT47 domain-containing protein n=1 Tax=Amborella trichopoda TaxID=13333 RepID=U5D138_AMBTC|nr:hypothetical protein AMTR_s00056p00069820 [Amborella trichopoda]
MEYNLWGNRKFHLELKSLILFLWVTLLVVSLFKCFSVPHEQAIWFLLSSFNVSLHVSGNNTTLNATSPPNQIKIGEIPSLGDGLVNITDPLVPSYNVKIPDMEEDPEPVEKVLNDSRQENATISGGMREKRKEENRVLDKQFSLSPLGSPLLDSFKNGLVPTSSHKQFLLSPLGSPLSDSFKNGSVPTSSQLNPFSFNLSQLGVQVTKDVPKSEISEPLGNGPPISQRNLTIESVPLIKYTKEKVSVVQKKNPMVQSMSPSSLSGSSFRPMKPRWSSPRDKELLSAKEQIQNAPLVKKDRDLYPPVFQNISMFKRSYELMERMFKIYIYQEGEKPIFHQPLLTGIYASEGWFMKLMEANKQFVVKDPKLAHMFYLPYSSRQLQITLYVPNTHMMQPLSLYLKYYVDMIAEKYPFWNRTGGSDHFLVACHDWVWLPDSS